MADLVRIQQTTPGTLSQQWSEDGADVDPGTVTIGITRWDGTVLVAAGTATSGTGTAARTYNLTTAHSTLLDTLKTTWTSTLKGTLVSYVEVTGGFVFSLSQARARSPLSDTVKYASTRITAARTVAEYNLEKACARAFVPRYELETLNGSGSALLGLKWPHPRAIRSVTVDGTVYTGSQLADIALQPSGFLYNPSGWGSGYSNIVVGYEHGDPFPPPGAGGHALTLAKTMLVGETNPVDDRAITFNSTEGGTYSLAVAGRNGSQFGQPDVDAFVARESLSVGIA